MTHAIHHVCIDILDSPNDYIDMEIDLEAQYIFEDSESQTDFLKYSVSKLTNFYTKVTQSFSLFSSYNLNTTLNTEFDDYYNMCLPI
jgi:hypothetical protein